MAEKKPRSFLVTLLGLAIFFGAIYFIMRYSPEKSLSTKKKKEQIEQLAEKARSSMEEGLVNSECVVCLDVDTEQMVPLLAKESFNKNVDMLYCYSKFDEPPGTTSVTHYWFFKGQLVGEQRLPVPKKAPYAVCSRMQMPENLAGKWHVDVLAANGRKMCTVYFRLK